MKPYEQPDAYIYVPTITSDGTGPYFTELCRDNSVRWKYQCKCWTCAACKQIKETVV